DGYGQKTCAEYRDPPDAICQRATEKHCASGRSGCGREQDQLLAHGDVKRSSAVAAEYSNQSPKGRALKQKDQRKRRPTRRLQQTQPRERTRSSSLSFGFSR